MNKELLGKYPTGLLIGFFIGFFIIHPFAMVFEGLFIPSIKINLSRLYYAFYSHHLPMAVFFGLLGMLLGMLNVYYIKTIMKDKKRIKLLEGLMPICSYCKKIRDDTGRTHGEGRWEKIEDYIYRKTDQEFTHGICPECTEKVFGDGTAKKKKDN